MTERLLTCLIAALSKVPEAARQLLAFLRSPAARPALTRNGLDLP